MPRKIITFTEEMERIIQSEADKRGAPFASIVREAIHEWAEKRGIKITSAVSWGGSRTSDAQDEEQGQGMAVPA